MKHADFLKNAAVISLGGLAAKGIGAFYRIPLAGALGSYGTGLYQMAYPLFVLLLTFSSTGIPSALARTVARDRAAGRGDGAADGALRLFSLLGAAGSVLMFALAPPMCRLQGDGALLKCYFALAPSVFFVAVVAALRGYFQGRGEMSPTALSEIVEQLAKVFFGLWLARLSPDPVQGAAGALLAVTISECVAAAYLYLKYRRTAKRRLLVRERAATAILFSALPVMASAAILPLSHMADSIVVVRLLARHTPRAVSLYGLLAGAAASLTALPATLCGGLATAVVPAVSRSVSKGDEEGGKTRALFALLTAVLLSLPFAVALAVFARPVADLLYPALSAGDRGTLAALIRLTALFSVFLAGTDVLAAALAGMGRAGCAALSMGVAVLVKLLLQLFLINGKLGIAGAAVAGSVCYTVAFFLDLIYTVRKKKVKEYDHGDRSGDRARRSLRRGAQSAQSGGRGFSAHGRRLRGDFEERKYPL